MVTARELAFLKTVVLAAQQSQRFTRVPASISLAQAILESGWGQSALAVKANNYFGIKALQGEDYAEFTTAEWISGRQKHILAKFARYASEAESFKAHALLLSTLPRYARAMEHTDCPELFAQCLQAAGYSTSLDPATHRPNYAELLTDLVDEFDLTQYDIQPDSGPAKEVAA